MPLVLDAIAFLPYRPKSNATMGILPEPYQSRSVPEPESSEELFLSVYAELRQLATQRMNGEAPGQTLQPTALVHEAWLNLSESDRINCNDKNHLLAKACEIMRCILIDRARRKATLRCGGHLSRIELDEIQVAFRTDDEALLDVNDALEKLSIESPKKAELVKLRFFGGLSMEKAAATLEISLPTANRWWSFARAWLLVELKRSS